MMDFLSKITIAEKKLLIIPFFNGFGTVFAERAYYQPLAVCVKYFYMYIYVKTLQIFHIRKGDF
ncbi:MAG: hypothetical protein LBG92_03355 [Prevotellaceae bacterium]|jgi:hypothetical protein|nr:hypothetical protein [Prevotellaceae bacterium]